MIFIEDIISVYKSAILETTKTIKKNFWFLFLPLVYSILFFMINYLIGNLFPVTGMLMGFIYPIIYSLLLSLYFKQLADIQFYNKFSLKGLEIYSNYFSSIYIVYFILMILSYLFSGLNLAIGLSAHTYYIILIIKLILFIIFNPLVEIIYIRGDSNLYSFYTSLEFIKNNFVHWIIQILIYLLVLQSLGYLSINTMNLLTSNIITWPVGEIINLNILLNIPLLIKFILFEIFTAIYIIFRAKLFSILNGSSLRKRKFMRKMYVR